MHRAERILKGIMLSAAVTGFLFGAAATGHPILDSNPSHYVSTFHSPLVSAPVSGHYDVRLPR